MSEDRKDKGWEYLQNDGAEGSFYEDDGSWGSQNSDGSGSYYGADGSWGTKNADGSASFYGADGSWGTRSGWKHFILRQGWHMGLQKCRWQWSILQRF